MPTDRRSETERLREVHRLKIDEWLEELRTGSDLSRAHELKRAIGRAMEEILEHRKRHGC